ncbi:hypothetical protein BB561_004806 [Smittium simulii]|uniref:Uncharacterized protein n=1 Tax=Smittium simulii TaxID=133385 RepID=A0A2T9YEA1_9FUNG|nr:hypothetical protein BB561_004806 [Smittium simulii]
MSGFDALTAIEQSSIIVSSLFSLCISLITLEAVSQLIFKALQIAQGRSRIQKGQHDQPIQTDPVDVELPHVVARAPVTDIIYYPKFLEVTTLVEKYFFRSPLPEEEWKDIIYSCPKCNVMHYTPPTLNNTASVTANKKIINNPGSNHKEAPDITFALEFRLMLADAASNITQLRGELVYKTINLPGRAPNHAEETNDSLFESEQFDTVVESKKKELRKPRPRSRRSFLQRQQAAYGNVPVVNATPTAGIKEQGINKNKIMELHSKHNKSGHTELSLVERSIKTLEWSIIHPRDAMSRGCLRVLSC